MISWNYISQRVAVGAMIENMSQSFYLWHHGITHILNVATTDSKEHINLQLVKYHHLGQPDNGEPKPWHWFKFGVEWCLDALREPGNRIYIHCRAGHERSPSMALAVLLALGIPYNLAVEMIKRARPACGIRYAADALAAVKQMGYLKADEGFLREWS